MAEEFKHGFTGARTMPIAEISDRTPCWCVGDQLEKPIQARVDQNPFPNFLLVLLNCGQ